MTPVTLRLLFFLFLFLVNDTSCWHARLLRSVLTRPCDCLGICFHNSLLICGLLGLRATLMFTPLQWQCGSAVCQSLCSGGCHSSWLDGDALVADTPCLTSAEVPGKARVISMAIRFVGLSTSAWHLLSCRGDGHNNSCVRHTCQCIAELVCLLDLWHRVFCSFEGCQSWVSEHRQAELVAPLVLFAMRQ